MKHLITIIFLGFITFGKAQKANVSHWIEDINFYQKNLEEKHIDLYHTLSKADFDREILKLKSHLPNLTDFQVIAELMKLTRKIGNGHSDGHTAIPLWNTERHLYPFEFFDFGDEIRVLKTSEEYSQLIGKKLIRIDGTDIKKIVQEVAPLAQFVENQQSLLHRTCRYMINAEILHAIGLTKNSKKAVFTFVGEDNKPTEVRIKAIPVDKFSTNVNQKLMLTSPNLKRPDSVKLENLWIKLLEDNKTAYIKYRRYPTSKEMDVFAGEALDFVYKKKVENLIIDLRDNAGGNTFLGLKLAECLILSESIDWKSGVYVLTDRVTYSASMANALHFRQILNAKIVGETTGGNPYSYQDLGEFHLPNSNLKVTYSKHLFRFQEANTPGVKPDVLITPKWSKFKKGVDEVMEWVINDINEK